jgi:hypothetical protein
MRDGRLSDGSACCQDLSRVVSRCDLSRVAALPGEFRKSESNRCGDFGIGFGILGEDEKAAPSTPSIQSLDRGITILEAVAKSSHPVPISQHRELLAINRSSACRLANTLPRRGLLANLEGRGEYIVGPAIWRLFRNYDWSMLVSSCRHHLKELADLTGETAHLGVREGRQALFIDHHTSRNQVRHRRRSPKFFAPESIRFRI